MIVVDIHAHAFADKIVDKAVAQLQSHYNIGMSGTGSVSDLMERAQTAGVDLVVLHAAATSPSQVEPANNWVSSVSRSLAGAMAFGTMHMGYHGVRQEMERLAELGLGGLKLHPDFQGFDVDDPLARPIFEAAQDLGLVVMCHCGDPVLTHASPERLARVIRSFPELTIIVAHLGGSFTWEQGRQHIVPLLADHPNVYTDTSSAIWLLERDYAKRQIELFGTDRILFGTDYPIRSHSEELSLVIGILEEMGVAQEGIASVLGGNALGILGAGVPEELRRASTAISG